ncbi:histidine kinase [Brevibacillus sp. SKDU10]|uniref:HAMP domain-containing sensor histidine kinase n=1 Tax=Brevibacillus sp. SKDU10 TaxID=1247872 RepID=UPI0007C91E39|nr:HAMP domain-containing sensor histidine kinase [Brevibacillus sp. SKDU10]OAJ75918.1 histidine kinase [Brevibacillus sp. SKDU10]
MKHKKIHSTLLWNYSIFIFIISSILTIALGYLVYQINSSVEQGLSPIYRAKDIVSDDYENIRANAILENGGWVEILNSNHQVIHVIGVKMDSIYNYTEEQLYQFLDNTEEQLYYYSIAPFTTKSNKKYICLVKIPRDSINIDIQYFKNFDHTVSQVSKIILKSCLLLFVPIIIIIFLYSRWTARKISVPLHTITIAIKKMIDGDYQARIHLKAESEFGKIRDAFNFLADKLEATRAEKEKLEESKQRMLMDISHDLKTPITSIQGYASALQDDMVVDEEKKRRYLQLIYNKSQSVNALINSLFDFLTLDDGQYPLSIRTYDLCEFIREITVDFLDDMEEKQFKLHIQVPEYEILYDFDYRHMSRVISNLISNAIKYNPTGTNVRIAVQEQSDSIIIEIADNGTGIPAHVQRHIFDPFVRGDHSRQTDGGTGLGLSIAHKIVKLHGGLLELDENPLEKTVFRITLIKQKRSPE